MYKSRVVPRRFVELLTATVVATVIAAVIATICVYMSFWIYLRKNFLIWTYFFWFLFVIVTVIATVCVYMSFLIDLRKHFLIWSCLIYILTIKRFIIVVQDMISVKKRAVSGDFILLDLILKLIENDEKIDFDFFLLIMKFHY